MPVPQLYHYQLNYQQWMSTGMKLLYVFSQGLAASHNFPSYISHSRRAGYKKSFLTDLRICQGMLKTRNGPLGQELSERKPTPVNVLESPIFGAIIRLLFRFKHLKCL